MTQKTGKPQFTLTTIALVLCLAVQAFAQNESPSIKPQNFAVVPSSTVTNQVDISIDLSNVGNNLRLKDIAVVVSFYDQRNRRVGEKVYYFAALAGGKKHLIPETHTYAAARSLDGTLFWNGAYAKGQLPGDVIIKEKLYTSAGKVPIASSDSDSANKATPTPEKPKLNPNLAAPEPVSPAAGAVFNYYPRRLTLKWKASPGAVSYTVELDCFHGCESNKWCSDLGKPWQVKSGLTATSYTFKFVGAQPGRWRVWAVDASGKNSPKSEWREFSFTK